MKIDNLCFNFSHEYFDKSSMITTIAVYYYINTL